MASLFAYHFRKTIPRDHAVTLLRRTMRNAQEVTAHDGHIRVERGGVVSSISGFESEVFDVKTARRNPRGDGRRDLTVIESLFVMTKAHRTRAAIQRLLPRISKNSTITLMQNGMGVYEQLVHDFFRNPVERPQFILASSSHSTWFKSFHHAIHKHSGDIKFGIVDDPEGRQYEASLADESIPSHERKLRLDDICNPAGDPSSPRYQSLRNTVAAILSLEDVLHTSWVPMSEMQIILRRKLVVDAVIHTLTAIMGCRNGDLFDTAAARRLLDRLCHEAANAFGAQIRSEKEAWLAILPDDAEVSAGNVPHALTQPALAEECLRFAKLSKGSISPMLADVQRGVSTEIDFINGYLLNLGSTYRVQMPATATLLNLLKIRNSIPLEQMLK
jgi:2-dehydropantoate 2-reductase